MLSETHQYIIGQGSLQAYLIGVARNQARRQMRHSYTLTSGFEEMSHELRDNSGDQFVNELSRTQDLHALRAAILKLPPNYREIVILCDLEGMDYATAAVQLDCAVGTVRSRLHRARAILKAKLQKRECPA
jgi:RNA polymerase sigma-70 factor, ECF subfamily